MNIKCLQVLLSLYKHRKTPLTNCEHPYELRPRAVDIDQVVPYSPSRTYQSIRRATWDDFTVETLLRFAREPRPTSCSAGEKRLRIILQAATKHQIPAGYVRDRLETLPDEAQPLIRERDRLRTINPSHPKLPNLNKQIADHVASSNREKWQDAVESCNRSQDTGLIWKLIGTTTCKNTRTPPNQLFTFNEHKNSDQHRIFSTSCKQFITIFTHTSDPKARYVRR